MTRLISYLRRIPDKVPDFTDEQVDKWKRDHEKYFNFIALVCLFYLAAVIISWRWPELRAALVAMNGM